MISEEVSNNLFDVYVVTKDRWSLFPSILFGSSGKDLQYGAKLEAIYTFIPRNEDFKDEVFGKTIILEDVFRIRGFYFLLFWIWVVISMMKAVEGDERWALLPFLLCGLSAILLMYEKTKEIGKKAFFISFFGGNGLNLDLIVLLLPLFI